MKDDSRSLGAGGQHSKSFTQDEIVGSETGPGLGMKLQIF